MLIADTVQDALDNVTTYEAFYGRCETWPGWLRSPDQMDALMGRERRSMSASLIDAVDLAGVAGRWPPPPTGRVRRFIQGVTKPGHGLG